MRGYEKTEKGNEGRESKRERKGDKRRGESSP